MIRLENKQITTKINTLVARKNTKTELVNYRKKIIFLGNKWPRVDNGLIFYYSEVRLIVFRMEKMIFISIISENDTDIFHLLKAC